MGRSWASESQRGGGTCGPFPIAFCIAKAEDKDETIRGGRAKDAQRAGWGDSAPALQVPPTPVLGEMR